MTRPNLGLLGRVVAKPDRTAPFGDYLGSPVTQDNAEVLNLDEAQ